MLPDAPMTLPEVATRPRIDLELVVASDAELEKPYRVIIQNDDVTPMEFVVVVLMTIFQLTTDQATDVMFTAHQRGRALVKVFPYHEAQERVYTAQSLARETGYPLTFYLEPDE